MTATVPSSVQTLLGHLQRTFAERLRTVVAYGPHLEGDADAPLTCLVLVESLTMADLESCARAATGWRRAGIATPLILPEEEFRQSLDAFPLEYAEILRTHTHVFGEDPFTGMSIAGADLRRACETQIKSHLLHLREGYIESAGHPGAIAELVTASAPAFAALLRNVARLSGVTSTDRMTTTRAGATAAGLADGIVTDILALEQPSRVPTADPARLFPEYLAAVEHLARAIDTWHT